MSGYARSYARPGRSTQRGASMRSGQYHSDPTLNALYGRLVRLEERNRTAKRFGASHGVESLNASIRTLEKEIAEAQAKHSERMQRERRIGGIERKISALNIELSQATADGDEGRAQQITAKIRNLQQFACKVRAGAA